MQAGLLHADGDYIFLIDSDLEEDPELLQPFWNELHKDEKIDVIYGMQIERKGSWFERWSGDVYYKLLNLISDEVKTAKNISTIRLMKKKYVKSLVRFQEYIFYFGPITQLTGFHQKGYFFKKHSRKISSYSFFKKYHIFLDSIISFSSKPLYFIFYLGICITTLSFGYLSYLIIRKLFWGIAIHGWTSLIVLSSLFGGINMFFMGLMSVYILHIFQETKNRPFSIVRKIHHHESLTSSLAEKIFPDK
jgi:putative glycosyltransferase